jgi:hypothetical protein
VPDIVITGYRIPSTYLGSPIGSSGGSGGDTSGWQQNQYEQDLQNWQSAWWLSRPTPCVTLKPSEADLSKINGHALAAVDTFHDNDGAHREILVIIWVDKYTGEVGKTLGQSSNQGNFVLADLGLVPANTIVVAVAHSHILNENGLPDPLPSEADRDFFDNMRNYYADNPQGTEVSENPLFYIWDAKTNVMSVYDRIKINGEVVQCAVEKD